AAPAAVADCAVLALSARSSYPSSAARAGRWARAAQQSLDALRPTIPTPIGRRVGELPVDRVWVEGFTRARLSARGSAPTQSLVVDTGFPGCDGQVPG